MKKNNHLVSFDYFCPKLISGSITPQGSKLIFETSDKKRQIILPFEMANLLILCNGRLSIRDIIEKIHQSHGFIHFKTIFKTIYLLKKKNFFSNGHELIEEKSFHRIFILFGQIFFQPIAEIYFKQKMGHHKKYPWLFYILAMSVLIFSFFSSQHIDSEVFKMKIFRIEGSYFLGLLYSAIFISVMLSLKDLLKSVFLLLLNGRVFNLRFSLYLFIFYFEAGNEFLFLTVNKLFLTLFYTSLISSYFNFAFLIGNFFSSQEIIQQIYMISIALTLLEFNPFRSESLLSLFLKSTFNDDNTSTAASLFKEKKIPSSIHFYISIIWLTAAAYLIFQYIMRENYHLIIYSIQNETLIEKISALISIGIISTFLMIVLRYFNKFIGLPFDQFLSTLYKKIIRLVSSKESKMNLEDPTLIQSLRDLPLFSYLSDNLLEELLKGSQIKNFAINSPVIIQGEVSDKLFVLLSGKLSVYKRENEKTEIIGYLFPLSIFGEIAVIERTRRSSTVLAEEQSAVLEIPGQLLRQVSEKSQSVREIYDFKNSIMVSQYFSSSLLFRQTSIDVVHLFLSRGKIENFQSGEIISHQGSVENEFYLVIRGIVGKIINGFQFRKIHQGGFFGETSILANIPSTATIVAVETTLLLKISHETFWEILSQDIQLAMFIESTSEKNIQEEVEVMKQTSVSFKNVS